MRSAVNFASLAVGVRAVERSVAVVVQQVRARRVAHRAFGGSGFDGARAAAAIAVDDIAVVAELAGLQDAVAAHRNVADDPVAQLADSKFEAALHALAIEDTSDDAGTTAV